MEILIIVISALIMIPGIFAVLFMLPGVSFIFIVSLVYSLIDKFKHISVNQLVILGGIAILSVAIDQLAGLISARFGGARGKTFLYAIAGVVIGTLIMPLFGGLVGLFFGILAGELLRKRTKDQAIKAATAGVIGTATGMAINVILAIITISLFLIFVIW